MTLALLVGCETMPEESVEATLTAPFEVSLESKSRAFDQNLHWSWEDNDKIAAVQCVGSMTVNTLSLKDTGRFGTDNFVYATNDPSTFMFVYPSEALNRNDHTLNFVQTGVWTPVLLGTVDNATVYDMPSIVMEHQSAAFEIRVWNEGRASRKRIKSATITSTADFLNGGGTTASVSGLDSDTVVFNIAEGSYDFVLSLVATDNATYKVTIPKKNFEAGKRTYINVEWIEPKLSYNILSSYTNRDNSLDGRSIYVKDIVLTDADSATIALYLNGSKAADMTPGQTTTVSNLTPGEYKAQVKWSAKGRDYTSEETTVYVTGIPYEVNFGDNKGSWLGWTANGASWERRGAQTVQKLVLDDGDYIVSPSFYVPGGHNIAVSGTMGAQYYLNNTTASNYQCKFSIGATNATTAAPISNISQSIAKGDVNTVEGLGRTEYNIATTLSNSNKYVSIKASDMTWRKPLIGSAVYFAAVFDVAVRYAE